MTTNKPAPRSHGCRMTTTLPDGTITVEVGCGPDLWSVLVDVMDPFQDVAVYEPIKASPCGPKGGRYLGQF